MFASEPLTTAPTPSPVVVITGASKGLGLAITTILLKEFNATVVAISRTRTPEIIELLNAHTGSLKVVECSVTDEPAFTKAITDAANDCHGIDSLILNAGTLEPLGRIDSQANTLDAWKANFDVNFFSLITALKAALPALRQSLSGGKVVFVSSGAATGNTYGWGPYNASKAALNSLTLAQEEPDIVTVAVRPGKMDTAMQFALRERGGPHMKEEDYQMFVREYDEGKLVHPEDTGYIIAGLALGAPEDLTGKFVSWNSEECGEFQRE
ncbi:hypothetical protein EW146_g5237 [Bondarzewia mesenterica]|uniref:Short-chain dehydrogenase n=1 Tax=Bondarzewia mesenterica TaxID=1095465 RepID=A0A4S4LSR5_9AGAM|nr:hypothetical protein EW146_g5237 [Bondarzewia mesenterica]